MELLSAAETWRAVSLRKFGIVGFGDGHDPRSIEAAVRLIGEKAARQVILFCSSDHLLDLEANLQRLCLEGEVGKAIVTQVAQPGETPLAVAAHFLTIGMVDSVVAGNVSTTAEVIRAAIRGVGLAAGIHTVSGSFMMESPLGEMLLFADCGVVIEPTVEQLVQIAHASVGTWTTLVPHIPPKVAFLSFSSKGSARHKESEKVSAAAALFKERFPDVVSDGELQFDAAFVPKVARVKAPESPIAGQANCFIFPNLNAGNIAYKLVQRLAGYRAYGPILQGLAKPFSDLSRGASVQDLVTCTYINQARS